MMKINSNEQFCTLNTLCKKASILFLTKYSIKFSYQIMEINHTFKNIERAK